MTLDVAAAVRSDFGRILVSLTPVRSGADETARTWEAVDERGDRFAVKLSRGGEPTGLVVSAHLAGRAVAGVPAPLPAVDGRPWSHRDGHRLSVVPWVTGERALASPLRSEHWASFGRLLRAVHDTGVPPDVARLLPREDHRHDAITARVREVTSRVEQAPVDVADSVGADVRGRWRAALPTVERLVEAADELGSRLRGEETDLVLCHGDPHLGNVVVGERDEVWLLDWDDAMLSERERDLMFVTVGVLAFAPMSERDRVSFFASYGEVRPDARRLAYFACTRALDDLSSFALEALAPGTAEDRSRARDFITGILSPSGLANLATGALDELVE